MAKKYADDDLPILTEAIGTATAELPILTHIIAPTPLTSAPLTPPPVTHRVTYVAPDLVWNPTPADAPAAVFNEAQMQALVAHFETHLETALTEKLNAYMSMVQHQAVQLALSELKSELPELLRKILPPQS